MPDAPKPASNRIPPALAAAGVLVVLLGFGLPALVSQPPAAATPPAPPGPADAFRPPAAPAPVQPPGNIGVALLRLGASLVVVCGGCVLAARRLGKRQALPAPAAMVTVASLTVGRCAVHLVRAGDRRLLIGTDAAGVKALVELPGPDPVPVAASSV